MSRSTLYLLAGLMAVVAVGCVPPPTQPDGGTTVNQNVNVNVGQGGPGASPSPGAGGAVARVGIGKFGERCPAGTQPSGNGAGVRVGCEADITCSPYNSQNEELFDLAIIGPAPTSFAAVSGQDNATFTQSGSNPYNGEAVGRRAGTLTLSCTVKSVTSQPYTLTVVQ